MSFKSAVLRALIALLKIEIAKDRDRSWTLAEGALVAETETAIAMCKSQRDAEEGR